MKLNTNEFLALDEIMYKVIVYRIPSMVDIIEYDCYHKTQLNQIMEDLDAILDFDKYDYEYTKEI